MSKALSIAGLIANLVGVLLLFRYGMPYRIPSDEGDYIVTGDTSPHELKWDGIYRMLGFTGLALVVAGTALQAWGTLAAE